MIGGIYEIPACPTCHKLMRLVRWDTVPPTWACDGCPPAGMVVCPADHKLKSGQDRDGKCVLCKDAGFVEERV